VDFQRKLDEQGQVLWQRSKVLEILSMLSWLW